MYRVTAGPILCVIDWDPSRPNQLTTLAVGSDRTDIAERKAATALADAPGLTSWLGLPVTARQSLVRACRPIPTLGMYCVIDDEQAVEGGDFLRCAVEDTVAQFLHRFRGWSELHIALAQPSEGLEEAVAAPLRAEGTDPRFVQNEVFPGLRRLARLSALVCRETEYRVDIPEDEDLLEIYDTYAVGSLSSAAEPW
ncbi:hypothetical protein [Streptomyces sp. NPDC047061]|uniref:hypothetical protein n=1 Tax=Streptomyces sp. NPDC047061 TaxID=3154605 RepID=UPI0033E9BDB8